MKTYVEIGACDFENLDGFLDLGKVLFVEPIPVYMESLKKKIGNHPNAIFEQSAISNFNGQVDMTYIEPSPDIEWWVKGISHVNFSSSNLINKNIERGYNLGKKNVIKVPALTLDKLLEKHNITEIEMLKIDVEGHEIEILNRYSWRIKPKQLKIEHKHCGLKELTQILIKQNYCMLHLMDDIYAVLKS